MRKPTARVAKVSRVPMNGSLVGEEDGAEVQGGGGAVGDEVVVLDAGADAGGDRVLSSVLGAERRSGVGFGRGGVLVIVLVGSCFAEMVVRYLGQSGRDEESWVVESVQLGDPTAGVLVVVEGRVEEVARRSRR